jgi:hypothetical protein
MSASPRFTKIALLWTLAGAAMVLAGCLALEVGVFAD